MVEYCKCGKESKYTRCPTCNKKYMVEYYTKNKEALLKKQKKNREDNKETIKKQRKANRQRNKEKIAKQKRESHIRHKIYNNLRSAKWYANNKERSIENVKKWAIENKEKVRKYKTQYDKFKTAQSIEYKIKRTLRSRLRAALKHNLKKGSAVRDLGCTVEFLKNYIENQFYPNPLNGELMSWKNYGNGKLNWQIDHKKALSLFDLTDKIQIQEAVYYTNLQPLWFVDHVKKTKLDRRSKYANFIP